MTEPFGMRLAAAVAERGPLCAGIDPSSELLVSWGLTDDAAGLREFSQRCVEAFAGVVAAVKPQAAFFERHGAAGLAVFEELVASARQASLVVIADVKRADVDTTSAAYAEAWLGDGPLAADAMTAVPYLGLGALSPMIDMATARHRGLFVVVRSSNPEGRSLQRAVTDLGLSVEDALLNEIAELNAAEGASLGVDLGSLGAVVGATLAPSRFDLAGLGGPVLAPGVGAQGATPADVGARFGACRPGALLPSASRSILARGPSVEALAAGAAELRDELASALG
ncbi:MAG TPA: orotidine-5'-phosphate decarboxylase [Acidimicrobiales bacterium]|nr:orotidine-5'-phosphate decarboxylase [Acidimicrobiales bacterium]